MLRHLLRDRFALSWTPERERREAAFAKDETNPGATPESADIRSEYKSPSPETQEVLRNIVAGTHLSAEAMLSVEHRENLEQSPIVLDTIGDIRHPSDHVQEVLRSAMERAGIPPIENEGPGDAIAAWHDKKREEKLLNDEQIAKARADILRNVTEDPETLVALIRSLEEQQERYREFVQNVERDTEDSDQREGSQKRRLILRAEAAEQIQAMMRKHDGNSVEQWMKEADPAEIRIALDMAETATDPTILRRAINLVQDWRNRVTFGMSRWNPEETEPEDDVKRRKQADYFAEAEKHINGLKGLLKEKLEKQANALSGRIDADVRRGSAAAAGIPVEQLYDQRYALKDKWDTSITIAHEKEHGVTLEETFENINAVVDVCKRTRGLKIHAPDFLTRADSHLKQLDAFSADKVPDLWQNAIVEAKREHKALDPWIRDYLDAYDSIEKQFDEPKVQEFVVAMTGAKDMTEAEEHLGGIAQMLRGGEAKDLANAKFLRPTTLQLTVKLQEMLRLGLHEKIDFSAPSLSAEALTKEIDAAEKALRTSRIQNSEACKTLGIPERLKKQIEQERLQMSTISGNPNAARILEFQMQQLQKALRFIENSIPKQPSITTKNCFGCCDFGGPEYFVNPDKHRNPPPDINERELQRTADHEFGHLVLDTFTERTSALMGLMDERHEYLKRAATNFGIPNDSVLEMSLETAAKSWGMDKEKIIQDGNAFHSVGSGEAYYRRKRTEELLMQYATYRSKRDAQEADYDLEKDKEYPQSVKTLFRILDAEQRQPLDVTLAKHPVFKAKELAFKQDRADDRNAIALRDGGDADLEDLMGGLGTRADAENSEVAPRVTVGPKLDDFKVVREQIKTIKNFLHTYPAAEAALGPIHQNAKEGYEQYFRQFNDHIRAYTENERMPEPYFPEEDAELGMVIQNATNALKAVEKQIKDFDAQKMLSVTNAQPQGKEFWLWFTRDIQWLSIKDYWTMTTEGWEDIKRLWKRRGETARGKVGELYTGWIHDRVPYAGQLKHEFHRRQQSSELEAVGVWEKALENVDSYKLIEDLPHVNNQDHLKAVMILLTKRGRLDWDDPELWRALNRFSHFKIPLDECHRDPILLEKWLQKVITDIWTDKDLYRTWKTTNEHSYDSERDKYSGVADFYSNAGLLGPQLEYMLKTFVEAKEKHEPIPDQVNPHLYEQLFLYAMEKGKMSMQQKFFYLVMGLKWKIIPFDRLSIINGKISTSTFPFIDFFYQHNHTEPEILELAESLIEGPNQRFTPGPKTTAFLIEEVAHDEAARQRVTKVISRSGTTIDHEDIPMVTGFMTQGGWNNFLIVSSGAIQRVTPEGLKNAYVGYNTMFKIYGMLAEKKAEDSQSLPPSDIDFLAARIVSYAHFDNVVVRQAIDNNNRPKLSLREIENETMPSGNNKKAKQYRDPMNELSFRVFDAYADEISQILESQGKFLGPEDAPIEGATRQEKYKKYRNMYLGVDDQGRTLNETPFGANHKKGGRIFKMSSEMEAAMIEAVKVDKGKKMTDILRAMSIQEDKFINEGDEQLSYVTHKNDLGRQKRFAQANGDHGHGGGH